MSEPRWTAEGNRVTYWKQWDEHTYTTVSFDIVWADTADATLAHVLVKKMNKIEHQRDMLSEACQELLDAIDQHGDTGWYSTPDERGVRPVLLARAAIAAATEEEE